MQINSINRNSVFYNKSFQAQRASNVSFGKINKPESEAAQKDMDEVSKIIKEYSDKNKLKPDERPEKFILKMAEDLPDILGEFIGVIEQSLNNFSDDKARQLRYLELIVLQTDNIVEARKNIKDVDIDIARGTMSYFYGYVNSLYNQKLKEIQQ